MTSAGKISKATWTQVNSVRGAAMFCWIALLFSISQAPADDAVQRKFLLDEANLKMSSAKTPGDFATAAGTYRKLVDAGVRNGVLFYNLGTALLLGGHYNEAERNLLRAERYIGNNWETRHNLLIAMAGKDRDKETALPWYRALLFWHYGLSGSIRSTIAASAFFVFWLALAFSAFGFRRLTRPIAILAIAIVAVFGSSVATSFHQEAMAESWNDYRSSVQPGRGSPDVKNNETGHAPFRIGEIASTMTRKRTTVTVILACALVCILSGAGYAQVPISAEMSVDRQNIFVNETFNLTISIDSTGQRVLPEITLLSMPDKSRLETGKFDELPPQRKVQDNQVREIRSFRCKARALVPGALELAPTIRLQIVTRQRVFMGVVDIRNPCDVHVTPLNISISPIPENGRPADFSGAVGQFAFEANAAPDDIAAGDLVTLTMKIHGDGNLEGVSAPCLGAGPNFKIYDPEPVDEKSTEGAKTFTQICVPQSTNAVSIPAVSFSYFDGRAAAYKTITRGPFPLKFHSRKAVLFEQYRPEQTTNATSVRQATDTVTQTLGQSGASQSLAISFWYAMTSRERRAVAVKNDTAMFAPSHSSIVNFDVPRGGVVTVFQTYGNWAKIALGDKRGWVPVESLTLQ